MFKVIVTYMLLDTCQLEKEFASIKDAQDWAFDIGEDQFYSLFVEDEFGEIFIDDFCGLMDCK